MKISVTQKHINKGIKSSSTSCPIALAMQSITGKFVTVALKDGHIYDPNEKSFKLPIKAQNFINKFDNSYTVKPFTFEVKLFWTR